MSQAGWCWLHRAKKQQHSKLKKKDNEIIKLQVKKKIGKKT